jgi:hypothetical protein
VRRIVADAELTLTGKQLVGSLTGCGVQFNQHTFAAITGAPPASFPDLEEKVLRLAPQFVRLFFNERQGDSGRGQTPKSRDSFLRAAKLARETGAIVNVTWQSGNLVTEQAREKSMSHFANVLEQLVATHGLAKLRWVTIQNEPNTLPKKNPKTGKIPPKKVTPERLDDMYRRLDRHLREKRLREQIRFMAGDLIRVSDDDRKDNQKRWFEHMDKNLAPLLDAYSVHIYWDYDKTDKFESRLREVRKFVKDLRTTKDRPIFITEYGVRGHRGPHRLPAPGIFDDGTPAGIPLSQTNIAAFQQAWFLIRSMQLGYVGTIKWDCFFGTYDSGYKKKHYVIGPPTSEGWLPCPTYHVLRLFTLTTEVGWQVLEVARKPAARTKQLVAAKGPGNALTIVGLDSRGAKRNSETQIDVPYNIDIGRPNATLTLVVWNRAGGGRLVADTTVTANARGVIRVDVPLHAVFAITTKRVTL